jgi:hypothetical protein
MKPGTRRLSAAVAVALGLHALVLLALALLPRAKVVTPVASKVLRVELRKLAPTGGSSTTEEKVPTPAKSRVKEKTVATGTRTPADNPSASAKDEPPARSRDWRIAEGIDRSTDGLSLRLDHPEEVLGRAGGAKGEGSSGLVREKSREEKLAEEKAVVARRVEGWFSDVKAKERAQVRDSYWQVIENALGRGFDPGWDVFEQGPKAPHSKVSAFVESWKRQAEAYGRSGNPFAELPDAPGMRKPLHDEFIGLANEDRGLGSVSLGDTLHPLPQIGMVVAAGTTSGQNWHSSLVALVRITQREDGSLFAVELVGSSGNAIYDRLVLGQARSLGTLQLGRPPQGLDTLWAFETNFTQIPPVPIAGCALDDFIPKNCWYPLQKRAHSRVRLQAIY